MFFLFREVAGWALVVFAVILIRMGITYIANPNEHQVVEGGVIMLTATAVLRAGILLVRMSTAARICAKDRPQ